MSKDESRNDRLTLRKTNEEVLRKKLQLEAEQACREETKAFGDCAKREGLWVVLNCRKENAASKIPMMSYCCLLLLLFLDLCLFALMFSECVFGQAMYGAGFSQPSPSRRHRPGTLTT